MDIFTLILLFVAPSASQGIKNNPPEIHQYQGFPVRGVLSPQQQAHIFNDVQQHRFQLGVQQHPEYNYQHQQLPDITFPTNQGFSPIKHQTPHVDLTQRPSQPAQQIYPNYQQEYVQQQVAQSVPQPLPQFVQPLQINTQFGYNQLPSIAQPPTSNYNFPTYQPQPTLARAPEPPRTHEPSHVPPTRVAPQPAQPSRHVKPTRVTESQSRPEFRPQFEPSSTFEAPRKKPQQYHHDKAPFNPYNIELTTTAAPYLIETQPPTTRKQKPIESITYSSEEYNPTATPKVVKYRIRPTKKPAEETTKKREKHFPELYNKAERQKLYQQAISAEAATVTTTVRSPTRRATVATTTQQALQELDLQEELQKQIQAQLSDKDSPYGTLKVTLPGSLTPEQIANLPQLALGDAFAQFAPGSQSLSADPASLFADKPTETRGRKKPSQVKTLVLQQPTSTAKPPSLILEELTKGVLPPGADFEVIRQKQDGGLEEVNKLNGLPQKKVTFVILEEQPDGSVKVQGVRGNEGGGETDVDSILQKIQQGEIKLPPSNRGATPQESVASPSYVKHTGKEDYQDYYQPTPYTPQYQQYQPTPYQTTTTTVRTTTRTTTPPSTKSPTRGAYVIRRRRPPTTTTTTPRTTYSANSHSGPYSTFLPEYTTSRFLPTQDTAPSAPESSHVQPYTPDQQYYTHDSQPTPQDQLQEVLKNNGLFAMAKFLQQSGLDSVLNETGPYTVFVPTDKAFRTLLVQLGGPDRADQKFKENPRLLSGLLLHHVIPGSFSLKSLQDEMTGVSLAGTQLRVNTYRTQDTQWNDLKVVTINGARIVEEKADLVIPQGVAHVVDRVMFPLPVGDIVQTLQADREQRFTKFIKMLQDTGVADMLSGTKTYTVFAPTDGSWAEGETERLADNRAEARSLVMRHITPGTLYSAGMHYYQLRDTMITNKQISLFKEAGRVKANNAHVVTRNIPATNGVIHAIDSIL